MSYSRYKSDSWQLFPSTTFTTTKTHGLPVLLQLRDQCITVLDNIDVLLVLVVGSVRLDDAVDAIDGARYPVRGDEFGKITGEKRYVISEVSCTRIPSNYLPIEEVYRHTEITGHAVQADDPVAL